MGSDEVQADAYDTLAKVAELIGMYDNRQVLIIGHSDAMGDAERNRQLSKRRAELVKQIFVETSTSRPTGCPPRARVRHARSPPTQRRKGGAPTAAWRS